jgi:hypothetical protein
MVGLAETMANRTSSSRGRDCDYRRTDEMNAVPSVRAGVVTLRIDVRKKAP